MPHIFSESRNFCGEFCSKSVCHDTGTIYIIMCVVLSALGQRTDFTGFVPNMQFAGTDHTISLFYVVGYPVGINENNLHFLGNAFRHQTIFAMCVYQRIAIYQFIPFIAFVSQLFIIIVVVILQIEFTAHHGI